jgi:hypothetical protein
VQAGGLGGWDEPKGFVGWSSAEGPNAAERDGEGGLRGGDEKEEGDGGEREGGGGGRTEQKEARGRSFGVQISENAMHSIRVVCLQENIESFHLS